MSTQLKLSPLKKGVSRSLVLPTHRWLTHAPSGESNEKKKMCAGLNP